MGAVLGLVAGVGMCLVWLALTGRPQPRRSRRRLSMPGSTLLQRAGVHQVSPAGLALFCLCSLVVGFAVMVVVSGTASVAVVFAVFAAYLPITVLRSRAKRRLADLAECWPEAVDNLASAVRAGLSLPEAIGALSQRGPEPLRQPFAHFTHDYQVTGRFGDCLDRLKERLSDPVGDRVVEALRLARDVGGGDLGRMLRSLSTFLREDVRTRSELEARQAWTVNGARLAVAAPWAVLLLMSFQRDVISRFASGTGLVILVGGATVCLIAYRLMMALGRLPVERRVLS